MRDQKLLDQMEKEFSSGIKPREAAGNGQKSSV